MVVPEGMEQENAPVLEEYILRPIQCELNILSRPDGSAMVTHGNTAIIAAVYGPVEVKPQRILIDRASVEVFYRPKTGQPSVAERMRECLIRNTCETALLSTLYPRTAISVIVQEMQDSGGLLSCAVNAACMALMNSGIAMKFLVAAVSCMFDKDDNIVLDPSNKELVVEPSNGFGYVCTTVQVIRPLLKRRPANSVASLTFVFDNVKKDIVASFTNGSFTHAQYNEGLLKCREASEQIFIFYRDLVRKYANRV